VIWSIPLPCRDSSIPEDWRDVVRAYQATCTEVIQRYDGHTPQLLGDGLLIYFGYPHAHEDDAHRAVRTGLGIIDAMEDLNKGLQQAQGIQLALRLGIHTGLMVVGEMGGQGRQEQLALGEVPNIASRIEGLAAPNTLVVSSATYHLIQGYFVGQDLDEQTLRGVAEPITVYQILRESCATSRLDVAQPRGLTPLVGREQEVGLLLARWEQVKAGHGQVVLLTGDAGIGKSRLVQMLKEHVANEPHVRWECRSSEYHQNTALFPLTDLLQRLFQFHAEDTSDQKLGKLEQALSQYRLPLEESVPLFAPLLSLPLPEDRYAPLALSPQRQFQKILEALVAILLEQAERHPVMLSWKTCTGLRYEAELHRCKGELLLQQHAEHQGEAETCFHQAIAIAQNQQAKSWELRASTSLARLWQQQGKRQEAHDLLTPVYGWFTEGFDTADLKDAKVLLDEL
jgi:class 3 adenylate cyclase